MNDVHPGAALRARLTEGRAALAQRFAADGRAVRLLADHCRLVDDVLADAWRACGLPADATLAAVGGYGRGELHPYSDVDILVLLPRGDDEATGNRVSEFLRLAWDSGLEIGHAVRTVDECLELAKGDITIQTNLLENRWIAGNRKLYRHFAESVLRAIDIREFAAAKLLEQQQRHVKFQDASQNLEPNLKEAPGGLRDLQTVRWISIAAGNRPSWLALADVGILTPAEARQVQHHERNLQMLRARLHYLAGRREDRLLFDYQTALARELGIDAGDQRKASEAVMKRYYRAAKAVRQLNAVLLQSLRARYFPSAPSEAVPVGDCFQIHNQLLEVCDEEAFLRRPAAILESFRLLQQHPGLKGMASTTLRALWRARGRMDAAYRRDPVNRGLFMDILRSPKGVTKVLRLMNLHGVLGRYLPAFGRIVGQMQHDLFHVYTVDEHILMVLRNLRRFCVTEYAHEYPLCSRVVASFERPEVLYLAALFHDIAKGRGGDHSTLGTHDALRFCKAHGLSPADCRLVAWLVQNHLVMSATAQKEDVGDPLVVANFARRVGDQRRLTALYLLTVADIRGTSPKVWNGWKGKLLEDLFLSTSQMLARAVDGQAPVPDFAASLKTKQAKVLEMLALDLLPETAHENLWSKLDVVYFLRHDPEEIAWHTRILNRRVNQAEPLVRARAAPHGEGLEVLVYTRDCKDLFARICHFFDRAGYSIVESKIHTTSHGYALDTFLVLDPALEGSYRDVTGYVEFELRDQLSGDQPLGPPMQGRLPRHLRHFPFEPEVEMKPDERGRYLLNIVAGDRPGLLSRIARVLSGHNITVHSARINTLGERAEDAFLISGPGLGDPKVVIRVETDLLSVLRPPVATAA